ncbi:MAG: matrixin family metalloprotease [SAR324 cluster bacterium]|nr:matrixin family metalloprotease [SAR324 cluster bacterium]
MKALTLMLVLLTSLSFSSCADAPDPTADNASTGTVNDYYSVGTEIYRWPSGKRITILLPANSDVSTTGYTSAHRVAFLKGITDWDSTIDGAGISYEIVTSGTADIIVSWSATLGTGILGYATSAGYINMATYVYSAAISTDTIYTTANHEFGHALGLWSHSYDSADVMYPYEMGVTISGRDKATMAWVYTKTATYTLTGTSSTAQPPEQSCSFKVSPTN